jgi:site-specific recombinase XerD
MRRSHQSCEQSFADQIEDLAVTLRPGTVDNYRATVNNFLHYLHTSYPKVLKTSQLRRDPHILGWLRSLHERGYKSGTRVNYLFHLRRLLDGLALKTGVPPQPGLIIPDDFPPLDKYLPKPLSPEDDRLLAIELRKNDDLLLDGLLLLRATGMRIGECLDLAAGCMRSLGQGQWALLVPLGKLHTERWIPVDDETRKIIEHILSLRSPTSGTVTADSSDFLFPRPKGHCAACKAMRYALNKTAKRAGCSAHVTPHQLRHSFATEMLRAGVSLPALKELLGHKDIRMSMRYVLVTQNDLQEQYRQARQNVAARYAVPGLSRTLEATPKTAMGIKTICSSLDGLIQFVEIYMRHLNNNLILHNLHCLTRRLKKISKKMAALDSIAE